MTGIAPAWLLYLTDDPAGVPLVMPAWARNVPELAALIDEERRRRVKEPTAHTSPRAEAIDLTATPGPCDT